MLMLFLFVASCNYFVRARLFKLVSKNNAKKNLQILDTEGVKSGTSIIVQMGFRILFLVNAL